jgi:hypothetical protein
MVKYTTESKLIDIDKIKQFTEVELARYLNNDLPICYQVGDSILIVGKNKITKINEQLWRVNADGNVISFFRRNNAICYCIAIYTGRYCLAEKIKIDDSLLSRLEEDARVYRYRYKQAIENCDQWRIDLYSNKYSEIVLKISRTKKELRKSLDLTKYNKP